MTIDPPLTDGGGFVSADGGPEDDGAAHAGAAGVDPGSHEDSAASPVDGVALGSISSVVASAAISFRQLTREDDAGEPSPLPLAATMMEHVQHASRLVYEVDELREMQYQLLFTMLVNRIRQVLYVDRTGGGKSHAMRMLATMCKGIHLYFCPLLALMADVALKFQEGNQ